VRRHERSAGRQLTGKRFHHRCGNFVLHRKHVPHIAIEPVGPELIAIPGIDQFDRNPQTVVVLPHASIENGADVQDAADLSGVAGLPLELKRRRARCHPQPRDLRQGVDQLLGNSVAEAFLIPGRTHIAERQDRNRRPIAPPAGSRDTGRVGSVSRVANRFESEPHLACRLKTLCRQFPQTRANDPIQPQGHGRVDGRDRRRVITQNRTGCRHRRLAPEWMPTGQHFVHDRTQRKEIGTMVDPIAADLFR
jgi:hypothetical protein